MKYGFWCHTQGAWIITALKNRIQNKAHANPRGCWETSRNGHGREELGGVLLKENNQRQRLRLDKVTSTIPKAIKVISSCSKATKSVIKKRHVSVWNLFVVASGVAERSQTETDPVLTCTRSLQSTTECIPTTILLKKETLQIDPVTNTSNILGWNQLELGLGSVFLGVSLNTKCQIKIKECTF